MKRAIIHIGQAAMFLGGVLMFPSMTVALCLVGIGFCFVEGGLLIQRESE